jgi:hypothetical protein
VLFNCCKPEAITKASKEIVSKPDIYQYLHHPPHGNWSSSQSSDAHNSKIFIGAYANKLAPVDPNWTMATSTEAQRDMIYLLTVIGSLINAGMTVMELMDLKLVGCY